MRHRTEEGEEGELEDGELREEEEEGEEEEEEEAEEDVGGGGETIGRSSTLWLMFVAECGAL
jgi:hypothetical protein